MKHTPGKWTVREDKKESIVSENRFVIECDTNIPKFKGTVARAGYLPYARLIASAPELLEALKNLLSFHESWGLITDNPEKMAVKLAEQAIAKAEGGE